MRFKTSQEPISGSDLLSQYCTTGAPEVFAQIMRAYGGMVFSVCLKVTKDPADAEDASQATFLTLAVQCKTGAKINYLGPWLKKVAKRSSLDLIRSKKRRTRRENITAENRPEHYSVHPGARGADNEISVIIRAELDELPAKYRLPLVLHYFGGLSHEEIGREMKITTAALGVRLHRGRKLLGKRLRARNISLEGMALSTAIVACVHHTLSEHFIHTTTQAVTVMAWSRPGIGSMTALSASLPASFGVVPQLVGQVARSMHRTRLMLATLALAFSVTILGGAAEAVKLLPESIRPNLDFLSPSKAFDNLFKSSISTPRVQNAPSVAKTSQVASTDHSADKSDSFAPYVPVIPAPSAPSTYSPIPFNHPTLAMEIPSHTQVLPRIETNTNSANISIKSKTNLLPDLASTPNTTPPTKYTGPAISLPDAPSEGSHKTQSESTAGVGGGAGTSDPHATPIGEFVPSGRGQFTGSGPTQVSHLSANHGSILNALDPSNVASALNAPVPVTRRDYLNVVDGSIDLHSGELFIHPGTDTYAWSDASEGITDDGVNSILFTVVNATPGVFKIEHLPRKTTLAPERPTGHTFIGIWAITSDVKYDMIAMKVKYDEALAQSLGLREDVLKLWAYDGTDWIRINDYTFSRDMVEHSLTGAAAYHIEYIGVSAPEPSTLGLLAFATGGLLRRRRK